MEPTLQRRLDALILLCSLTLATLLVEWGLSALELVSVTVVGAIIALLAGVYVIPGEGDATEAD